MSGFPNIRQDLKTITSLERELNLKQLQINRLLNITQAINNNVKAKGLFDMYKSFLNWEMGVEKMALYFKNGDKWECVTYIGIDEADLQHDISGELEKYTHLNNLAGSKHPLIKQFQVVIPVNHKEQSLAYAFIGDFGEKEEMFNKVQFITTITNIIAVAIENKRLFKQQLEQEKFKHEMELASEMQMMLIPKELPKSKHYELSSIYLPHLNVGGDYFDFIELENDRVVFCIADISGKGMAAALLMANFQAYFHSLWHQYDNMIDFVKGLNEAVLKITKGDRFTTFFVADYDIISHKLRYINCGHNPPALAMKNEVIRLDKGCTILGIFEELPSVEMGEILVDDEALILLFTDGLIDIKNKDGEFLDQEYGRKFILENYHLSASEFNEKMMKQVRAFNANATLPDDFTVLTCKIFK
ncbi:MAG: serine/threonine protein phosphatase [Bacteroidetes bacterium]|nr:MAG: serine/threonine protein phosphatase [Bacteroidota bacterium]